MIKLDLAKFFELQDVGSRLEDLDTPVPIIDVDVVMQNLLRWQERCTSLGIANWPHIKTHKLVGFAKLQLDLGAAGITVQKLTEAEVMAAAGIENMLLTFNVVGEPKLKRLAALLPQVNLRVVADNPKVVVGLGLAAKGSGQALKVLVECDTGAARNGVQSPAAAAELATLIAGTEGLSFGGLMTYPKAGSRVLSQQFLAEAARLILTSGLTVPVITTGGTPDMWSDAGLEGITEYRAGTYIYADRSMVARGMCNYDDCALSVLTTVVSTPTPQRAMLDAGSKSLTSDLLGLQGYGVARETNFSTVYDVSEEHGFLDTTSHAGKLKVGDLVRIVPNHVCPVSNLFDKVVLVRGQQVLGAVRVDGRGAVQ